MSDLRKGFSSDADYSPRRLPADGDFLFLLRPLRGLEFRITLASWAARRALSPDMPRPMLTRPTLVLGLRDRPLLLLISDMI